MRGRLFTDATTSARIPCPLKRGFAQYNSSGEAGCIRCGALFMRTNGQIVFDKKKVGPAGFGLATKRL